MCNDLTLYLTNRHKIKEAKEKINLLMWDDLMVVAKKKIRGGIDFALQGIVLTDRLRRSGKTGKKNSFPLIYR
jgi:hypothetical protein